jgi:transposase-like protein
VLEGLYDEKSIADLCRKEGSNQNIYYRWPKEYLAAGKKRLADDMPGEATSEEVKSLLTESNQLKEMPAELMMENRLLKKACSAMERTLHEVCGRREAQDHTPGRAILATRATYPGATEYSQVANGATIRTNRRVMLSPNITDNLFVQWNALYSLSIPCNHLGRLD